MHVVTLAELMIDSLKPEKSLLSKTHFVVLRNFYTRVTILYARSNSWTMDVHVFCGENGEMEITWVKCFSCTNILFRWEYFFFYVSRFIVICCTSDFIYRKRRSSYWISDNDLSLVQLVTSISFLLSFCNPLQTQSLLWLSWQGQKAWI